MALNEKHKLFVVNYIATNFNAIEAYELTYPKSTRATARTNAYKLLANKEIKAEIEGQVKMILEAKHITAERVLLEIADIAFALKGDEVYDVKAKLKALELLQKQMGLQTTNSNINATIEPVIFEGEDTLED